MITTDGQENVVKNLERKSEQANQMFDQLVRMMSNELKVAKENDYTKKVEVASWL